MRLGLLGPVGNHAEAARRALRFLLEDVVVDRAVYLGLDGALDDAVRSLAEEIVGDDPTREAVWARSVAICASADAVVIDAFVEAERECEALRIFESLPPDGARSIEILGGKVAVMIHDKAHLDEEDIGAAGLLLFGRSDVPLLKQVGARWFISPGTFGDGGIVVLDDEGEGIEAAFYDADLGETRRETITVARAAKLRVADAG